VGNGDKSQMADDTMTLKRLSQHGLTSHLGEQTESEGLENEKGKCRVCDKVVDRGEKNSV